MCRQYESLLALVAAVSIPAASFADGGLLSRDLLPINSAVHGAANREISAVLVSPVERDVTSVQRDPDGNVTSQTARLTYRIDKVFVGNPNLVGTLAKVAVRNSLSSSSMGSYKPWGHSEWLPEPEDEGIWLVYENLQGELRCLSAPVLRIPFPVYASGVHNRSIRGRADYMHVKEFMDILDDARPVALSGEEALRHLVHAMELKNPHANLWAAWFAGEQQYNPAASMLQKVCSDPKRSAILQGYADAALLQLANREEWRVSRARKAMIARWLTLDGASFLHLWNSNLEALFANWDGMGYGEEGLYEQVLFAYRRARPDSLKRHLLKKRFPEVKPQSFEIELPAE